MATKNNKTPLTLGQLFGAVLMIGSIVIPGFFWGITYLRDLTNTYCSGECVEGWYAVISTFFAIPSFFIGVLIYAISSARKASREAKEG